MVNRPGLATAACCLLALPLDAQTQGPVGQGRDSTTRASHGHTLPVPAVRAAPRNQPVRLDGRLDDAAWQGAEPATDFRQQRPHDGVPATQRTEIRLLYDDEALYIGARMYDTEGASGVRGQLARRDRESQSDNIQFIFDTYHDHVGRTMFSVNPSGVKSDAGQASAFMDSSWDPVWDVATAIDSLGWTAEFRIPFSQLRFSRDAEQAWGLQVWRYVHRLNEISMWSYWSQTDAGGPSRFGHVVGIRAGRAQRRAELLPYVVGQLDRLRPGPDGDPFYNPNAGTMRVGADLKYRLNTNLTLDATINPDFGQVEVDPAVVNLSAFETFFPERRPFFIEGGGIFSFGSFNCYFCSNVSSLSLFYSRRIGRRPQGALPSGTEYSDIPDGTSILGAAKITGRSRAGWSVGLLNAVTAAERARIMLPSGPDEQQVEPFTNYFVGRLKRDLRGGNLTVGLIGTSVLRNLSDPLLESRLPSHAEALGFDWNWYWKNRAYRFLGSVAASNVAGDPAAIDRIQRSSARYFQRPDRRDGGNGLFSDRYDPTATRLGGYAAYGRVAKEAGAWLWEAAVNLRSPGFEVNDLAFLTRADYVWTNANLLRQWTRPTGWYRSMLYIVGVQQQVNYDGDLTDRQLHGFAQFEFLNYWSLGGFYIRRPEVDDDRALRGGPVVRRAATNFYNAFANTDFRKPVAFDVNLQTGNNAEGARSYGAGVGVTLRPASNVQVNLRPDFNRSSSTQQYVTAVTDPTAVAFGGRRYVMADLAQDDVSLNTRVNVTFTPTLTLEVFAQPFISSVNYERFKEFDAPRQLKKSVYGVDRGSIAERRDTQGRLTGYDIDPDGPGVAAPFRIGNPDFNFRSLRGNAVLRWEYRPGSTVFLVWTQDRSDFEPFADDLRPGSDFRALRRASPNNIFLIKFNYWLNF
jgi:hypothetical protein